MPQHKYKGPSGYGFISLGSDFGPKHPPMKTIAPVHVGGGHTQEGPTRVRVTNQNLPPGTRTRYNKVFMPKLIEVVARLANPWELQVIDFPAELE